jgi:MFS family permease
MPQRYVIVGICAVAALWLYIDRICFSTLADPIKLDLILPQAPEPSEADGLSPEYVKSAQKKKREENPALGEDVELSPDEIVALKKKQWADGRMSYVLGAYFLTYALFQIPIGALADRFGARLVLTVAIAAWSLVTAATGFAESFAALLAIRLMLGITESGAYPAAAGLVKNWAKPEQRGLFSSFVALGGRIGGFIAPLLTAWLAVTLAGVGPSAWLGNPSEVNWRGVFVLYGLCGLSVAVLFWLIVRDRPAGSGENAAPVGPRRDQASTGVAPSPGPANPAARPPATRPLTFLQRVALLARTRNMWLYGAMQFGVNIGWVFLITLLPTYLNEAFGVPLEQRGLMQTVVLGIGILGMLCGGFFTDAVRARLGPRLGRSVPLGIALGGCAVALLLIPAFASVWLVLAALAAMAFLVDLHNPTVWSFAQDVGGRNVGAALGFGNMWGNLGGALSPVLLNAVKSASGWDAVFVVGAVAFAYKTFQRPLPPRGRPVRPLGSPRTRIAERWPAREPPLGARRTAWVLSRDPRPTRARQTSPLAPGPGSRRAAGWRGRSLASMARPVSTV